MNLDILAPILILSGIAVGLGIMLYEYLKSDEEKFDERQLIERGRGANFAMYTAFSYLLGLYVGQALDMIRTEHMAVFAFYGLAITVMVYDGYCILRDAFLNREQTLPSEVGKSTLLGTLWLVSALFIGDRNPQTVWIDGALALAHLSRSAMLLLRALMVRIQDRQAEKE